MINLSEDKLYQKTKEDNKIFLLPEETIKNLTKQQKDLTEDFNLSKLIEILNKSAMIGTLKEFFHKLYEPKENHSVSSQNNLMVQAFTYILINKFNPDYKISTLNEEHLVVQEITKNLVENLLIDIKVNSEEKLINFRISLKIVLLNLLLLKFKHSILLYDMSEKLISIKSYFRENAHINDKISEFLSIYLEISPNTILSDQCDDVKDLQAINYIYSNSTLFKSLIEDCNNGRYMNEIQLKVFYDKINSQEDTIDDITDTSPDDRVLLFDRHMNCRKKIQEIVKMDLGSNFLFYGNPSSGKTTFAKLFTKDEIVIDVDETIEVNNLLGGYLINEFSEIIWQDGLLIKSLVSGKDLIIRNMEKCSNELLFILKQILEKNSVFLNLKQEHVSFAKMPKIFFIYNLDAGENLFNSTDLILNLLLSNTFNFRFNSYSDAEKIKIALNRLPLLKKIDDQHQLFETIIDTYNKVVKKYKFNTRFRELNLTDLIKFAERVEMILNELNIIGVNNYSFSLGNGQTNPIFLSERNKMKIISNFIFLVFYTLDDSNLIKLISIDFANSFNFDANTFSNLTVNFMEIFSNSDSNLIKGFQNERISFDQLTNTSSNMYSYNSNSKFYTKLINESVLNQFKENILLVGETGVGKTTMIQNLAKVMNTKLNVINLSQSSDVSELFGGFKPIHPRVFLKKYFEKILNIIQKNFSSNNRNFINSFYDAYQNKEIDFFIKFSLKSIEKIEAKIKNSTDKTIKEEVNSIKIELMKFKTSMKRGCYNAFTYIDGILLDAIKKDEWILLDEINLASDDLLLKLCPILEGEKVYLVENNELVAFERGPKFRIFGSMNPEYNIGKKRLPHQLRSQFTEIFVHEIKEFHDIKTFVKTYLHEICCDEKYLSEIAKFYIFIKEKQSKNVIQKSNGAKCNFSLRNLSRTLITIRNAVKFYDIQTGISEAINMNFMSLLNESSINLIKSKFFNLNLCGESNRMDRNSIKLSNRNNESITNSYFNFNNYFIKKEFINPELIHTDIDQKFILTKTFKNHLNNLMRIVTLSDYAVLLEGPTSVGKTSIIEYIGKKIGQKILRINNNQNTEIEEYIGNYTTDSKGQFYFQEGFLVKAVREGFWIILDEINLAPSEVLESLNRLLDDNRELFISELNTTIQAHPNFKIFAAMNPSEMYAGRKDLSEAFKNRFIHLYFDNIPEEDLGEIIEKRCKLPKSRVDIMVQIFNDLQKIRSSEGIFAKKEGFITIRDLLKWGSRDLVSYDDLAYEGYFVIAEKLRNDEERGIVKKTIEEHLHNKVHMNFDKYFDQYISRNFGNVKEFIANNKLCLNRSTKRMLCLVDKCLKNREPVLLIGETGTGKTVVCEYLAEVYRKKMITISCHENVDTGDFLGSLRSVYGREEKINQIKQILRDIFTKNGMSDCSDNNFLEKYNKYRNKYFSDNTPTILSVKEFEKLSGFLNKNKDHPMFLQEDKENIDKLNTLIAESHKLFEWIDGPLTSAMKQGELLIIDEISLALDSVLERMNSVFEADRVLVLSENHTRSNVEIIHPDEGFMIIASMNPSGDHGKRELSPALRSRFSEIFVDTNLSKTDLERIYEYSQYINHNFEQIDFSFFEKLNETDGFLDSLDVYSLICFKIKKSSLLTKFSEYHINHTIKLIFTLFVWYNYYLITNQSLIVKTLTLRDVDMIIDFFTANLEKINTESAFISIYNHSVHMTLIDGVFLNESSKPEALIKINKKIIEFTMYQTKYMSKVLLSGNDQQLNEMLTQNVLIDESQLFGVVPFIFPKITNMCSEVKFIFHTENIKTNLTKILRGLTTGKPIIIEGSPGVGKTTIIQNLAKKLGKKIYRINLSEHTDMIDLIGSEYPTDDNNSKGITFKWVDGVFLKALINGDWIIIDEMNLASQSILEGLNSVLDHRKSLFVSELSKEFKCHPDFQIFATQNPVNQGGGRKFLPKSFLNRFVKIYLNDLSDEDYKEIMINLFPTVQIALIDKLTHFNYLCHNLLFGKHKLNMNEVGEFNLRTLIKILEIVSSTNFCLSIVSVEHIMKLMYISRIRTGHIRKEVRKYLKEILLEDIEINWESEVLNDPRHMFQSIKGSRYSIPYMDSKSVPIKLSPVMKYSNLILTCIESNFPLIVTGHSGIGKKEIIRYLANKTNNKLFEFALNSSMDSTELLGNFDKINLSYHIKIFKEKLSAHIKSIDFDTLTTFQQNDYLGLLSLIDFLNTKLNNMRESLHTLKEKLKALNIYSLYEENVNQIEKVTEFILSDTFNFEWHDSILINCIINGYWIILDNVNTCSSAVLDRLNSLLDDDKQIYLNESGVNDGRVIKPHKNFRIFMIMNEKYGEVSRALKNRCVEIYFDKKLLNVQIDNKPDNIDCSGFTYSINEKLMTVNYSDKSVALRRKSFDDYLVLCENLRLFDYNISFYATIVYLFTISNNVVDYRLFKKYFRIFDKYYTAETAEKKYNLIRALTKTISLLSIRSELDQIDINAYVRNLVKSIKEKREIVKDEYTSSSDLLESCQFDIYHLRNKVNLNIGSDTVNLVDKFSAYEKYISLFQNDFNKLIARSPYYMEIIRNIDSKDEDSNRDNDTKRFNNLCNLNKILFKISSDKIFNYEMLNKIIYSHDTSDEEIKTIIREINDLRKYISGFNTSYGLFITYSFIMLKSNEDRNKIMLFLNSFNSNEKQEISHLKNIFVNLMNSCSDNLSRSISQAMNKFYLDELNNKNVEKQIKKLINSREEDRISNIFTEIANLGRYSEDCILFKSLVDFILNLVNKDNFLKFIQTNSESFLFVFESLIENFATLTKKERKVKELSQFKNIYTKMKKMCINLDSQLSEKISKSIFFFDNHNTNMQFRFHPVDKSLSLETFSVANNIQTKSDYLNFDLSFIFNLNNNQSKDLIRKIISNEDLLLKLDISPLMNIILLEFDLKSAKTYQDILNIKNYYSFTEKVNEILTNEKLIVPVISNKTDMLNVQIFVENIIKYTNHTEDYDYSEKELFYSFEDLTELNFLQKHQKKSGLDSNLIKFLLNAHGNNSESLKALSLDLVNILILNEYSSDKTIEKVNYISNISQSLISHFVNNYKKLFFIPFYFFYSKTVTENIVNNFSKIVGMNKLGRKIKLYKKILTDLQDYLFDKRNVLEINKSSNCKLEILEDQIIHAELIATLSIPDKKTISKILGKDLFKLFYEILIENKERNMFSDKLVFELENSSSDSLEYKSDEIFRQTKVDDLKIFEYLLKKVEKFEKDPSCISSNYNYDNFVKSLSKAIERFLIIKSHRHNDTITANHREEFKLSLKSLIDNHIDTFSFLILPFALSSLVYCSALNEKCLYLKKEKRITKYFLDKVEYLDSNFDTDSEKMLFSFLYKSENLSQSNLMVDILQNKLDNYNKKKELEAEAKLSENQNEFYSFREKLKIYETVNMRVLETTQALDETSQAVRDKMKEEEELKEIEENFPTYQNDFKNFDRLELIDLTKNININNFYNNKKDTDSNNQNKGKDILYYTYLILKKNIVDSNAADQSKKDLGFSLPITSDYYHTVLFSKLTNIESNSNTHRENTNICRPYNNLKLDLSFILENQFKFYKLKSNEGFSMQRDEAELDIEEGFSNLNKQNAKASTSTVIYNFYKDPNPKEIRYLYIVLNKLLERLSLYLQDHQDHPLLILILIITFNLLELDINSTPLSKVLSGLDVLLTKLKEWETYASKRINSLEEDIKSVMILIRRFRKIEIVSWRGLLNSKMKEYERKDCLEYFNTVYKIFVNESLIKNTDEISETINLFVLNSNFASFEFRINCIKIFSSILSRQKDFVNRELINCLLNVYNYYNNNFLLSGKLEEYKSLQLAEIEGKVKDLINIAKWDIKNYFNFRDNMKRNYKQLNKILKNFDNFCLTNIKEFIEYSSKDFVSKDYILTKFVPSASETEAKDYFDCFSQEIFSRLESLRKLASNSNGSDRKDKIFKQKALIDLIKTLKNLGFSTIYKFFQNEVYNQFKKFSLDFIENYKSIVHSDFYFSLQKSSSYVTKILEKINNFNLIEIIHEDLNNKYLDTMKGISFSSFFKSLSAYTKIQDCVKVYSDLVRESHHSIKNLDSSKRFVDSARYITWINLLNEFLICFNKNEINLEFDSAGYIEKNKSLIEKFETLKQIKWNFEEFLTFNISKENNSELFLATEESNILKEFITTINNLITNKISTQINSEYEIISHNFKGIVKEISSCKDSLILQADISEEIMSGDIDNNPKYNIIENYSTYITKKIELLAKEDNSFYISNTIDKLFDDFSLIEEKEEMAEDNEETEINIDDFLNKIGIVQNHYSALLLKHDTLHTLPFELKTLSNLLKQMSDLMHSLLKLTNLSVSIFYNVSVNGFCQPTKTTSDNKGENDKGGVHEGGFGMSEGEGMEDISKQIEDEEQLLGLKEEKLEDAEKQDKKDGKPIDKNSGFEVKADFKEEKMDEIPEDEEEEEKNEEDDDNLEREKDDVDNARGNQMYDKDNEVEGDNEEDDNSKERGNVDLTDKNVSMKNQEKDNDYKSKDESRKEENEKNVEKPEEIDKNDKNQSDDANENDSNQNKEESKKIEKLDVNKNDADDEKDSKAEEEDQMDLDINEIPDEKLKEVDNKQEDITNANEQELNKDDDPMQGKDEDLFGDDANENKMEVEEDNPLDNNEEDAEGEEGETKQRGGEEAIEDDVDEVVDREELFKSNPIATKNEDLGYNPISNNKGSGGNTAERSKENKDKEKNEENDNINEEQLDSLEKYEEIFDLNSMLESVWQTRPSKQDNRKRDVNKSVKQDQKETMQNQDKINQDQVENNFDFHNHEEKEKEQTNQKEDVDFDMGYADNSNDKKASGFDENKNEMKDDQKISNMEEDINSDRNIIFNDKEEKIEIDEIKKEDKNKTDFEEKSQLSENDQMDVEESSQSEEENEDLLMKNNADNAIERTKKEILIEMDKQVEKEDDSNALHVDSTEENEQTLEKLKKLESEMLADFQNWSRSGECNNSIELWNKLEQLSNNHINKLVEHLKIAMEPNKQTKLRGNYKSGKRLNIKKIISFIASNYRNDKIWLRRTLPFERNYYVMLAIDDSLSMKEHNLGFFAMESLVIVSTALNKAGIGKLCICSIKEDMEVYHNYNEMFNKEKGAFLLSKFKFDFSSRLSHDLAMTNFMKNSMAVLENLSKTNQNSSKMNQIVFILSDGRFNKDNVRSLCIEAREKGLLYVFIILDKYGIDNNHSILNMNSVKHVTKPNGEIDIDVKPYLDDFPFAYYVIVEDSSDLPEVVHTILVKWFTLNN